MIAMCAINYVFILILVINPVYNGKPKKVINIGVFLDESPETNVSITAVKSGINRINMYSKSKQYIVQPHIFVVPKHDILQTGQLVCSLVAKGVAAIFGPESPEINEIIQSVSSTMEIPQFQTFWNPKLVTFSSQLQSNSAKTIQTFNLFPSLYAVSKALSTLVRENDWKSYTVIYEHDDGLVRLQETLKERSSADPAVTFRKLGPGPDHRSVLKEIKKSGDLQIILDCETDTILPILQQAYDIELLEEYHSYILTSLDAHTLDWSEFRNVKANISALRLLDPNSYSLADVVRDWELVGLYQEHQERPLEIPSSVVRHGLEKGLLPGPLTGPINQFDTYGQRGHSKLQIIELSRAEFRLAGMWDPHSPNVIHANVTLAEREKELKKQIQQKTFRVVSRIGPPYLMRRTPANGQSPRGNARFEGYAIDLIDGICAILNCSYTFELVEDGMYGNYNPKTKEWNGLIRHLLDRKADLAVCDLTITYERRTAVDFTMPFMTLGISILYAKAVKEPPELLSFSHPLSLDVWLYMATAYLVISMIIFLVARLNPNDWENPHPCNRYPKELENIWNIKNCCWLTLGSIMAQGCDILPKGISTRMVAGMWWFFSLIMTASYTANMAAFLTMERMGPTIESADDLAGQTKIKYGCLEGGSTSSFFKDSNFSTYHRMWVQMEAADPTVFEKGNNDGVKRVLTSKRKYAFLMESSSIEYEMERNCELMQVGSLLDSKGYGIAMPTNAPYRKSINEAILKMQEMGTLHRLKEKWWKEMNGGGQCKEDKHTTDATATELDLGHVGGVFVVLAAGVSLAVIISIFEFLWNVKKIAVAEKITLKEAFNKEIKFAMNIWARQKAVNTSH